MLKGICIESTYIHVRLVGVCFFGLLQVQLNDVILNTAIDIHGKGAPIGKAASNDALACLYK